MGQHTLYLRKESLCAEVTHRKTPPDWSPVLWHLMFWINLLYPKHPCLDTQNDLKWAMQTCGPSFRNRCWTLMLLNYSKLCEIATKYLAYLLPLQCHSCILVGTCCKQKVPHFHFTSTMFDPGLDRLTTVALRYSHPNPNEARTKSGAWNLPLPSEWAKNLQNPWIFQDFDLFCLEAGKLGAIKRMTATSFLPLAGARATARNDEHSPGQSHLHGIWKTFSWEILSFHQEKWREKNIYHHPSHFASDILWHVLCMFLLVMVGNQSRKSL